MVFSYTTSAQEQQNATSFGTADNMYYVPSLASRMNDLIPSVESNKEAGDKRSFRPQVVPGKDPQTQDDYFVRNRHEMEQTRNVLPPLLVFDAVTQNGFPTDPSLAVGPNHVVVVYNTGFRIFDKLGNPLTAQLDDSNIFTNASTCCDLTVSYDNAADRWVLSVLSKPPGSTFDGLQIAVSDGPNPVTAGWNSYQFLMDTDYQKLSVWSDGYYIAANKGGPQRVHALERTVMLAGGATPQIIGFDLPGSIAGGGFFGPQAFNVTDANLPAAGGATFVLMQDDAYGGVTSDHVKLWTVDVDWVTPANSTVTTEPQIPLTPFISVFDGGGFDNLVQPGGFAIDALQSIIMNQAQFRKFGTHNSAVFNFTVDTDAGAGKLAGVRWVELRQTADNQPWTLYQEGTYTAPNGRHAWCASMAMDVNGNIAIGYTSMSGPTTPTTVRVSSYYSGRMNGDPLGTMTIAEELIANGTADIDTFNRYGDYSKMDVDPSDGLTFWFDMEYMNPVRKNVVGAFKFAPPLAVEDFGIAQSELIVVSSDNNQFDISLVTSFDDIASIAIFNLLGQQLAFNNLRKEGDRYNYQLDMSYAASGVYLIKIGDQASNTYKTAKIIVK